VPTASASVTIVEATFVPLGGNGEVHLSTTRVLGVVNIVPTPAQAVRVAEATVVAAAAGGEICSLLESPV
jgi:hypothetical protein